MKKSKNVFTNSMLYTVGNLMLKAFSFFLIPLYTSYLSTEAYGEINLASGFYGVAAALLTFSLSYAVARFYADYRDDQKMVAKMIGTAITFVLLVSAVFVAAAMFLGQLFSDWFFGGLPFWPIVFLSVLIAVVSGIYSLYQEILKGMQQAGKSIILSYVYFFLLLGSNIVTVVWMKQGATGVLWSTFLVNFVMILIMMVDLLREKLIIFGIDGGMLKALLKYSVPLIPHTMAFNISQYATKLIISEKLSLAMLGIYSLASQFGTVADVVLNSVQAAFQPWMFSVLKQGTDDARKQVAKSTYSLMWLYGLIFLGLACFSQEVVILIADPSYLSAWLYVPVVVVSISLKAPLYFYNSCMYFDVTKTKYVFVNTLVGSIVNIAMTWILVPVMQIYGSIVADILAMMARLIFVLFILPKEIRQIYSLSKMMMYSLISVAFIIVALLPAYFVYTDHLSILNFGYKVLVILVYIVVAALANKDITRIVISKITNRRN